MENKDNQIDSYQQIQNEIDKIFKSLNAAQQNLAKESLKNSDNHSIYIKGKSLVNLICHDYCLGKYPFKNLNFDYEFYVSIYLESERYDWLMANTQKLIEQEWKIVCSNKGSIKILYILSGAFTTETNNKNRQQKIKDLKQILYYIFELNFIATNFTRPNFNSQACSYKQIVNGVFQKLDKTLKLNLDCESEDLRNPLNPQEGIHIKPILSIFKTSIELFGQVQIYSLGELNKNNSTHLLCKEILYLITCFKECQEVLSYIQQELAVEEKTQQVSQPNKRQQELLMCVMSYMEFQAKKNISLIYQQSDEMVEDQKQSQQQNNNSESNIQISNQKQQTLQSNPNIMNSNVSIQTK